MWDRRVQEKLEDMVGTFFVLVRWQGMVDGFIWACLGVYGPNENSERGVKYGMSRAISFPWKKYHGDRSPRWYVSRKEIIILSSPIRWLTPIEGIII